MMRIGHGYDIHRFEADVTKDYVMLGGVKIPYERGILAHSDGDVVIHAICDALLGACALGDIGEHFPDTDPQYSNLDSGIFLKKILAKVQAQGYKVGNIDVSIIAQAPRLSAYKAQMQAVLATDLNTAVSNVNIKATTHERLDAVGNKLGIAVHAVALIIKE